MANHLQRLIETYFHKWRNKGDVENLWDNPNIDLKFLLKYPILRCGSQLLRNTTLTKDDLKYIVDNKFIINDINIFDFDRKIIISNQNMTLDDAYKIIGDAYPHTYIRMGFDNKDNITMSDVTIGDTDDIYMHYILCYAKLNVINEYLNLKKTRHIAPIYSNPSITLDIIKNSEILNKNINYEHLSMNTNINIQYITENKKKDWNWICLFENLEITLEDIYERYNLKHKNMHYDVIQYTLSREDLTLSFIEFIYNSSEIQRDSSILTNPSFSFADAKILATKYYLNMVEFSLNPNLTFEIVRDNPDIKWGWDEIFRNEFEKNPRYITAQNCREKRNLKYKSITNEIISNTDLISPLVRIIVEYIMFI
jgi:hypothetical protein